MENKNYCGILYEVEDTEKFGIAKTEIDENRINSPDYCWSENYYLGNFFFFFDVIIYNILLILYTF